MESTAVVQDAWSPSEHKLQWIQIPPACAGQGSAVLSNSAQSVQVYLFEESQARILQALADNTL